MRVQGIPRILLTIKKKPPKHKKKLQTKVAKSQAESNEPRPVQCPIKMKLDIEGMQEALKNMPPDISELSTTASKPVERRRR